MVHGGGLSRTPALPLGCDGNQLPLVGAEGPGRGSVGRAELGIGRVPALA